MVNVPPVSGFIPDAIGSSQRFSVMGWDARASGMPPGPTGQPPAAPVLVVPVVVPLPQAARRASAPERAPIAALALSRNWRLDVRPSRGCMSPPPPQLIAQCKPSPHDVSRPRAARRGAYGYIPPMASAGRPTLPGRDYHAPDVFELEREKI